MLIPIKDKELVLDNIETSITLHPAVTTLSEGLKALNIPSLTPKDVPKLIEDFNNKGKDKEKWLAPIISLLVDRGLSGAEDFDTVTLPNIQGVLQALEGHELRYLIQKGIEDRLAAESLSLVVDLAEEASHTEKKRIINERHS